MTGYLHGVRAVFYQGRYHETVWDHSIGRDTRFCCVSAHLTPAGGWVSTRSLGYGRT